MTCHGSALLVLAFVCAAGAAASKCDVTFYGALAGNRTGDARLNAAAFQAALHVCDVVHVPPGVFKITPVVLPSHTTLWLDAGASLVGSDLWRDYGVTDFMPRMGRAKQLRPLLSATNATNITITGGNGTIDGNGWFAWYVLVATPSSQPPCSGSIQPCTHVFKRRTHSPTLKRALEHSCSAATLHCSFCSFLLPPYACMNMRGLIRTCTSVDKRMTSLLPTRTHQGRPETGPTRSAASTTTVHRASFSGMPQSPSGRRTSSRSSEVSVSTIAITRCTHNTTEPLRPPHVVTFIGS